METVKKQNKKKRKQFNISLKDIIDMSKEDKGVSFLLSALADNTYSYHIKKALYKEGKLSSKGFLNTDDVLKLKIAKKDSKGNLLIDNCILDVLDRKKISDALIEKEENVTSLLIKMYDEFYDSYKQLLDSKISKEDFYKVYHQYYDKLQETIQIDVINSYIKEDENLKKQFK